jgi:hypothetical protein
MGSMVLISTSRTRMSTTGRASVTAARCACVATTVIAATRDVVGWSSSG